MAPNKLKEMRTLRKMVAQKISAIRLRPWIVQNMKNELNSYNESL